MLATGLAILSDVFPPSERGRALGINAIALALGASAGPTLGGLITEHLDWRWIFYVNVPIGLVAVVASYLVLPQASRHSQGHFDVLAPCCLVLAWPGSISGCRSGRSGAGRLLLILTLVVSAGALVGAVLYERRAASPLLDLHLFHNRVFSSALVSLVFSMLALFAIGFLLPFYLEELRGFSTQEAGLLLTPFSLTIAVVGPIAGSLADRYGSRWLAPVGLAIMAIGLVQLTRIGADSTLPELIVPLVVGGLGQGLFFLRIATRSLAPHPGRNRGRPPAYWRRGVSPGKA